LVVEAAFDQRLFSDRFESPTGVAAGLVPASLNVKAQSKNNRGGWDEPGHDP
jgi:hypothetical protein